MSIERALWLLQSLSDGKPSRLNVIQCANGVDISVNLDGCTAATDFCVTGRDLDEAAARAVSELEDRIDLVSQLEASEALLNSKKETTHV